MKKLIVILAVQTALIGWEGIEATTSIFSGVPDANINKHLSTTTGEYYIAEADVLAPGVEPLSVTRVYLSEGECFHGQKWTILPHLYLKQAKQGADFLTTYDPNGAPLVFRSYPNSPDFYFDTSQLSGTLTNISGGKISGQTNSKNYKAYRFSQKHLEITTPTGTKRNYCRTSESGDQYFLISEHLSNQNKIIYDYYPDTRIRSITSFNHDETKVYAQLTFEYNDKLQYVLIKTHTGDWAKYSYTKAKADDGKIYSSYDRFESNTKENERMKFDFQNEWKKFTVKERKFADNSCESVRYYKNGGHYNIHGHGKFNIKGDDPRVGRVESVAIDPVGDGNPEFLYQVLYHIPEKERGEYIHDPVTEVVYATHAREKYKYTKRLRLVKKTRYNLNNKEHHSTDYHWGTGYLNGNLVQQDESGDGCIYLTKKYCYNKRNDVVSEDIIGDITGEGTQTHYSTYYAIIDDDRHLPHIKRTDDGTIETYWYIPGTTLPRKTLIQSKHNSLQRRIFYKYDKDNLLVQTIEDDGMHEDIDDLTGATYRKRVLIIRKQQAPALGYPEMIAESGYDFHENKEKLISSQTIHYNERSQITTIDQFDADYVHRYSLHFAYDEAGRCVAESDPLGRETVREYAKNGLLLYEKNANSKVEKTNTYDNAHRLIIEKIKTPDGLHRSKSYAYNLLSHKTKEVDELGNVTKHLRDEHGFLIGQKKRGIERQDLIHHFENDHAGRPKKIIDPEGRISTIAYTCTGQRKNENPHTGPPINKTYYPNGLLKTIQEHKTTTHFTYDQFQRETSKQIVSNSAPYQERVETKKYSGYHLLSETDFKGITTAYTYDHAGRIQSKRHGGIKEEFSYDALGNCNGEKKYLNDQFVGESKSTYDLAGRKTEELILNAKGEILKHIEREYGQADQVILEKIHVNGNTHLQTWEYDGFNRPTKHTDRSGASTVSEYTDGIEYRGLSCLFKKTYLPNGLILEEIIHPDGYPLKKTSTSTINRTSYTEEFSYNKAGELLSQKHIGDHQVTISYFYDERSRLIAIEEQNGNTLTTTSMTYNQANELVETTKPDGVHVTRNYDCFGQETQVSSSDKTIGYEKTYSANGDLTEMHSLVSGGITSRCYDRRGNLTEETFEHGYTIQHKYDELGRKKQTTHPDGSSIRYQYRGDHLKKITLCKDTQETVLHTYDTFNDEGSLLTETRGDGSRASYTYDTSGRLLANLSETYNETVDAYSETGNVLSHTIGTSKTYTYNAFDQLTSEGNHLFEFNTFHQLTSIDGTNLENNGTKTKAINNVSYQYDQCGRRSKKITPTGDTKYRYDAFDRLIEIHAPHTTITYAYDALNRLVSETTNGITKYFIYDDTLEIGSLDNNHTLTELRILGLGLGGATGSAVALFINGTHYIPVSDILGNIRAIYSPDQTLLESYSPTIFGDSLPTAPISPWIYQSKRHNNTTGLIYFGDRFYDPQIIAWISPDPIGYQSGPNLYQFLHCNPFKFLDEFGDMDLEVHPFVSPDLHKDYNIVPQGSPLYCYYDAGLNYNTQSRISTTQVEDRTKTYIDGLSHESPTAILCVNGINTTYKETTEMANRISEYSGGHNVHFVYNQTHGYKNDLQECLLNLQGHYSKASKLITSFAETMHNRHGEKMRLLLISHSQGGIHLHNALEHLNPEIRKCIHVINIAGARNIPIEFAKSSINYRAHSNRDFIPYLQYMTAALHPNPSVFASRTENANIRTLKSHPNAPLFDHSFLSPTYQDDLEEGINRFLENGGLY